MMNRSNSLEKNGEEGFELVEESAPLSPQIKSSDSILNTMKCSIRWPEISLTFYIESMRTSCKPNNLNELYLQF